MKYKPELTTGSHTYIDHVFVNIREFEMPQQLKATKMSHEKRIHRLFLFTLFLCLNSHEFHDTAPQFIFLFREEGT